MTYLTPISMLLVTFCRPVVERDDGGESTREDSEAGYAQPAIAFSLYPNETTTMPFSTINGLNRGKQ